ncbi:MAG TPA: Rho termination factor N-terminal domain-containing protein, partial [Thiolinea sp.]|nr:Rho termination factor N-terminal domain-containing protein [Thiolinea sp.]
MNLSELKKKPTAELYEQALAMGVESISRVRKQDIIFAMLKTHAQSGEDIYGDG